MSPLLRLSIIAGWMAVAVSDVSAAHVAWGPLYNVAPSATTTTDSVAADLDGDGDMDIAAIASGQVSWYRNDSPLNDGTVFSAALPIATVASGTSILAAEISRDAKIDLVVWGGAGSGIVALVSDAGPNPAWASVTVAAGGSNAWQDVQLADIDRDGSLDVVAAEATVNAVRWYRNNSDGSGWTVTPAVSVAAGTKRLCVADFSRDGLPDIACGLDNGFVQIARMTAAGGTSWSLLNAASGLGGLSDLAVAEVSNDGALDLLVSAGSTLAAVRQTTGNGQDWAAFVSLATVTFPITSIAALDQDADGDIDVAASTTSDGQFIIFDNPGSLAPWTPRTFSFAPFKLNKFDAADVDRNGRLDIVAVTPPTSGPVWIENRSFGRSFRYPNFELIAPLAPRPDAMFSADIDRDGDDDLVSATTSGGGVFSYINPSIGGGAWTIAPISDSFAGAARLQLADIDRDGDTDVVAFSGQTRQLGWFENRLSSGQGWAALSVIATVTAPTSFFSIRTADVNLDGAIDVLASTVGTNAGVAWYRNNGSGGGWTAETISAELNETVVGSVGDVDRDGDNDVLIAATAPGDTLAWYRRETSGWTRLTIPETSDGPFDARLSDPNLNGVPDVVTVTEQGRTHWTRNNGTGTSWTTNTIGPFAAVATRMDLADVDADGDSDLLLFNPGTSIITLGPGTTPSWTFTGLNNFTGFSPFARQRDGRPDIPVFIAGVNGGIALLDNTGAQIGVAGQPLLPAQSIEGTILPAMVFDAVGRGRVGDNNFAIDSIRMGVTDAFGTALNTAQLQGMVDFITYVRDTGSGTYTPDDELIGFVLDPIVSGGFVTVPRTDNSQINAPNGSSRVFVIVGFDPNAGSSTTGTLRLTLDQSGVGVADATNTIIPLSIESFAPIITVTTVVLTPESHGVVVR